MDVTVPKRRTCKKKLVSTTYPDAVVCQYSRFSNLLSHAASRKWLLYEWQYDDIEDAFFHKCRTFEMFLAAKFPQLKTHKLTRVEWRGIRKMVLQRKCRRFSSTFLTEQRIELEKYRCSYRILQKNNRDDQLAKLNTFQNDDGNGLMSELDAQQSHNQLHLLLIEVKKLFASKSVLVMKLREINNSRADAQQQQQQQNVHVNGNSKIEPAQSTNTTAIKVITKIRDCNNEIMAKFNQMMCFQITKDALLYNAMKRKNIALALSPAYFQRMCAVQLYESQQHYRSETFIATADVQTLLNALLTQVLTTIQYELTSKLAESVESFADDLIKEQMALVKCMVTNENMDYFESVCAPKISAILDVLNKILT